MKSTRPLNLALFALNAALIVSAAHWLGCASPSNHRAPEAPGFYYTTGWYGRDYDADIDGTVGHPLYVNGPTAHVVPSNETWYGDFRITSGSLPPGLTMSTTGDITGIPTERGHWIVTVEISNVQFRNYFYKSGDKKQQLRFHITGSGEVNQ